MASTDYVYALHDFHPENDDEVSFSAGERIFVLERDDLYGDGWWRGRNQAGKEGLFPASYTSSDNPNPSQPITAPTTQDNQPGRRTPDALARSTSAGLESIREHDEPASAVPSQPTTTETSPISAVNNIPKPYSPADEPLEANRATYIPYPENDEEEERAEAHSVAETDENSRMMRATMTDVQMAIEQLGMHGRPDGARSFSFASSITDRSASETEMDDGESELRRSDEEEEDDGEWHKDARQRLAEKARRAADKERRAREREAERLARLQEAPPIDVELSDESEPEEGETMHNSYYRRALEGDATDEDDDREPPLTAVPRHVESPQPTATRETFDLEQPVPVPAESLYLPADHPRAQRASTIYPPLIESPHQPTFTAVQALANTPPPPAQPQQAPAETPAPVPAAPPPPPQEEPSSLPTPVSPAAPLPLPIPLVSVQQPSAPSVPTLAAPMAAAGAALAATTSSSDKSGPTAKDFAAAPAAVVPPSPPTSSVASQANQAPVLTGSPDSSVREKTHPSEWTVDDVVDWLKSKGFDQGVCDRFIEQEITGDVLLDLDANVLKSELGIVAYGKRVRLANAIQELRRPPSVTYSDPDQRSAVGSAPPSVGQRQSGSGALGHPQAQYQLAPIVVSTSTSSGTQLFAQQQQSSLHTPASTAFSFVSSVPSSLVPGSASPPHSGGSLPAGSWFAGQRGHGRNVSDVSGMESVASSVRWGVPSAPGAASDGGDVPGSADKPAFGLGLGVPGKQQQPPRAGERLALSPSDGALGSRALSEGGIPEEQEEDRTAVSEGEAPSPEKHKRRLFGRSFESGLGAEKKDEPPVSPVGSTKSKRNSTITEEGSVRSLRSRHSKKRSLDVVSSSPREPERDKKHDRLSIFGGMGGISKSRKPAPKYSTSLDTEASPKDDKASILSSFVHGGARRSASIRPRTADASNAPASGTKARAVSASSSTSPVTQHAKEPVSPTVDTTSQRKVGRESAVLRKRTYSASEVVKEGSPTIPASKSSGGGAPSAKSGGLKAGQSILEQIGTPDHNGWMRKKGERYNSWKMRYFVLKGPHLYCLRSNSKAETKIKGYINITGYRILPDEDVDPGRYGFKITHGNEKVHYFSSEEQIVIREWMKALIKATITRDYKKPVISSVNIPTIPLSVAQTMNPAPRPPSPTQRDATQRALRRENTTQLSTRDAKILQGIPSTEDGMLPHSPPPNPNSARSIPSGFRNSLQDPTTPRSAASPPPPRPMREARRENSTTSTASQLDPGLIEWANSYLPRSLQITDTSGSICNGLQILRLAEAIKGKPASPPVLDSAFPTGPQDERLDGLFRLFDFLLDNDVRMGSVSINDIRQGRREKIIQMLKALRQWEDKRRQVAETLGRVNGGTSVMMPAGAMPWTGH